MNRAIEIYKALILTVIAVLLLAQFERLDRSLDVEVQNGSVNVEVQDTVHVEGEVSIVR